MADLEEKKLHKVDQDFSEVESDSKLQLSDYFKHNAENTGIDVLKSRRKSSALPSTNQSNVHSVEILAGIAENNISSPGIKTITFLRPFYNIFNLLQIFFYCRNKFP